MFSDIIEMADREDRLFSARLAEQADRFEGDAKFRYLIICAHSTVVSEKKGTFLCELILERYIYLRITQKQLKITNYARNKSFWEFL